MLAEERLKTKLYDVFLNSNFRDCPESVFFFKHVQFCIRTNFLPRYIKKEELIENYIVAAFLPEEGFKFFRPNILLRILVLCHIF
jgi:hypothetical protein